MAPFVQRALVPTRLTADNHYGLFTGGNGDGSGLSHPAGQAVIAAAPLSGLTAVRHEVVTRPGISGFYGQSDTFVFPIVTDFGEDGRGKSPDCGLVESSSSGPLTSHPSCRLFSRSSLTLRSFAAEVRDARLADVLPQAASCPP